MNLSDLHFLLSSSYAAYLLLGGLLIVMYAFNDVRLPASRTFIVIAAILLVMCTSFSVEHWAAGTIVTMRIPKEQGEEQ